jgi:hypothetical protein
MKLNTALRSQLGVVLILIGILIGLALTASVTWAYSEADLYVSYNADRNLALKCPLMLAPNESGAITAKIKNLINESITPTVSATISHAGQPRRIDQVVTLQPQESQTLQWTVNPTDLMYDHLILAAITQLRYRDNPSMLGSCGILLFSLLGLNGLGTLILILTLSLAAMVAGVFLWQQAHPQPWNNYLINLSRAGIALMGMTILALLSLFPRLWGITLILDAATLLMMGIIFTDFVLFQKYKG